MNSGLKDLRFGVQAFRGLAFRDWGRVKAILASSGRGHIEFDVRVREGNIYRNASITCQEGTWLGCCAVGLISMVFQAVWVLNSEFEGSRIWV